MRVAKPTIPCLLTLLLSTTGAVQAHEIAPTQTDFDRVAQAIMRDEVRIEVPDLADRIIAGRKDHVLIDIRQETAFTEGHIDTAMHMTLADLLSDEGRASLPDGRKLILYSDRGAEGAQAAALLRLIGLDAHALEGGYRAWEAYVAGPTGTPKTAAEGQAMAKQQAVACYFQGDYMPRAGIPVSTSTGGSGYTPPLKPAQEPSTGGDALGLGLGLGLGPESAREPATQQAAQPTADPLGLGLGVGGAGGPTPASGKPRKLNIGEGC